MFIKTLLSIWFISKCLISKNKSVYYYIRSNYNDSVVKKVRRWEKLRTKMVKTELDMKFLNTCLIYNYVPRFMRFKLYKSSLYSSQWYKDKIKQLLHMEIKQKEKEHRKTIQETISLKKDLSSNLSIMVMLWLTNIVNTKMNKFKKTTMARHEKKLTNNGLSNVSHLDPDKVIFNHSNRILTKKEKLVLSLGLNFKLPILKLNHSKYFLDFEFLLHSLNSHIPLEFKNTFTTNLKNIAHSYYNKFNPKKIFSPLFNLSDFHILKSLQSDSSIIITKPDKGRGVVILDKTDYTNKMLLLLSDTSKYKILPHTDVLRHIISIEDRLNRLTRSLRSQTFNHTHLHVSGTAPGIMYGVPKIHKPNVPLRPVLNAINTPSYKLSKAFIPILTPLTTNQYSITNSYSLSHTLINTHFQQSTLTSFDIQNLFTNIPINETVDIIVNSLFTTPSITIHDLNKDQFHKLLTATVSNSPFLFNNTLYSQSDGMPMGNPLGPTFANIFLSFHETRWLNNCPTHFKPLFYKRYIDDLIIIFQQPSHIQPFLNYLNNQHPNIHFTIEREKDGTLPFLDILISHNSSSFSTSVYRKPTNTLLGTNFFSHIHPKFLLTPLYTLFHRAFHISSDWTLFHNEITFLQTFFSHNYYPSSFFYKHLNKFLNNTLDPPMKIPTVLPLPIYIKIPFLGKLSAQLHKDLYSSIKKHIPYCKPIFIPSNSFSISSFFKFKDTLPLHCRSGVIYKYKCGGCEATYIGHTALQLHIRICKHKGVSYRTLHPLTNPEHSNIRNHSHDTDHPINNNSFSILASNHNDVKRIILETIFIKTLRPSLNTSTSSFNTSII